MFTLIPSNWGPFHEKAFPRRMRRRHESPGETITEVIPWGRLISSISSFSEKRSSCVSHEMHLTLCSKLLKEVRHERNFFFPVTWNEATIESRKVSLDFWSFFKNIVCSRRVSFRIWHFVIICFLWKFWCWSPSSIPLGAFGRLHRKGSKKRYSLFQITV